MWAGDTRRKLFENFIAYEGTAGLLTITAPGAQALPWDRSRCKHGPDEPCSGPKGCRVVAELAVDFNSTAPRRWRALHNAASQYARRRYPGKLTILGLAWEYHQRGVLHRHVVVGLETPVERAAAQAYGQRLKLLAGQWGFGLVDTRVNARPSRESAAYISSYFITGKGAKATIRETVKRLDVPPMVVYVSRALTRRTGITMRSLRHQRYLWALSRRYKVDIEGAQAVADYIRNTGVQPAMVIVVQSGWLIVNEQTGEAISAPFDANRIRREGAGVGIRERHELAA